MRLWPPQASAEFHLWQQKSKFACGAAFCLRALELEMTLSQSLLVIGLEASSDTDNGAEGLPRLLPLTDPWREAEPTQILKPC